jgi:hypothetical protein
LIFEEFFKRQNLIRKERIAGIHFEEVPFAFTHRYVINGEISSCKGFRADLLYIQYLIHIPSGWKSENPHTLLAASTQLSYCTLLGDDLGRTAFFGFPLELNMICGINVPQMPSVYLKVLSIDGEDRHCVEGYGHAMLSSQPGAESMVLNTWKPRFHFTSQTRAWFLGGSPDLQDLKFNELEDV